LIGPEASDLNSSTAAQGCQMVYFQTKVPIFGTFWNLLQWKMLVYVMAIWSILQFLVYFVAISDNLWGVGVFFHFGNLYREKSGNPVAAQ
jgi:hypothetical protein